MFQLNEWEVSYFLLHFFKSIFLKSRKMLDRTLLSQGRDLSLVKKMKKATKPNDQQNELTVKTKTYHSVKVIVTEKSRVCKKNC